MTRGPFFLHLLTMAHVGIVFHGSFQAMKSEMPNMNMNGFGVHGFIAMCLFYSVVI